MSEFSIFLYNKFEKEKEKNKTSIRSLALELGISHNYLRQIFQGKVIAPEREFQEKLANKLVADKEKEHFFDLAAIDRKDIPIDILEMVKENEKSWSEIREILKEKVEE